MKKNISFLKNYKLSDAKAQSMVEVAISLPIILLLFSGMVEFGFMLNTYLSLQDATRATARLYSNETPFTFDNNGNIVDKTEFYSTAAQFVVDTLNPSVNLASRAIPVDSTRDNVTISVVTVDVDEDTDTITSITRHPDGYDYYQLYNDTSPGTSYDNDTITDFMTTNGSTPVDAGLLIIEVYYSYEGTLQLPWTDPFFTEDDPIILYASTIMPLVAALP